GNATINIAYSRFDTTTQQLWVAADGEEVEIKPNSQLVLGYGIEQQVVTISNVSPTVPGQIEVQTTTLNGQLSITQLWGGMSVSNVRPGYPGVQPDFSYNETKYKAVVPYIERVK